MKNSKKLSKSEFSTLRKQVFAFNPAEALRRINRDEAIFAALQAAEFYKGVYFIENLRRAREVPDSMQIVLQAMESLHFTMRWIFQSCFFAPSLFMPPSAESKRIIADLIEQSYIYTPVDQLLDTVSAEFAQAERLVDGTICISQVDQSHSSAFYANGSLTKNQALAKARPDKMKEPDPRALTDAINTALIRNPHEYSFRTSAFQRCLRNHDAERAHMWNFSAEDSLGNYTFGDLRKLWICLYTICLLHVCVCHKLKRHVILFKTRSAWTKDLSEKSGLSLETVDTIMDDLIYDPSLYRKGQSQANVASQPFFPVGHGQLALSNILVISSDAERNIWELISIKRQKVFSTVESAKEKRWTQTELIPWLNGLGYEAWSGTKYNESAELSGDVDLLVLDRKTNFALAIELKWLKAQHSLKDLEHINETLEYATQQAQRAIQWLKSCPPQILQRTGITAVEFGALKIEPLVVSRNSLGGPALHSLPVPVINEFLMQLVLDLPHKRSLQDLARVARTRSYLPKYGVHFVLDEWEETYAGKKFRSHLSPKILRDWEAITDMGL